MKNENDKKEQPNVEIVSSGLHCDNPKCDWEDKTVIFDNLKAWVNKPCPKCGENVLTLEDYVNAEQLRLTAEFINTLSTKDLDELGEVFGKKDISEVFKGVKGADTLKHEGEVLITISTHKKIQIEEVKNV